MMVMAGAKVIMMVMVHDGDDSGEYESGGGSYKTALLW